MSTVESLVPAVEVAVDGTPLEPARLLEVRLDQNLMLPDAFTIRVADPEFEVVDAGTLGIGKPVTVSFCSADGRRLQRIFEGEITTLEPEFSQHETVLTVRGYDASHRLNRERRSKTYQDQTSSQIARRIAQDAGLAPRVEETGPQPPPKFTQQNNETDWEFLWRLASMFDFEVLVEEGTLYYRPAGGDQSTTVELKWGDLERRPILVSFHPRVTGVQQIEKVEVRVWDPVVAGPIEATARVQQLGSSIGIGRDEVAGALGGGTIRVADAPVTTQPEAQALADSLASQLGHAFLEADGVCEGDPRVAPGTKVKVEGIGRRFGGEYTCSKVAHVYRGGRGYFTKFTIAGRTPRSLLDLMTPGRTSRWGDSLVVGVVTQNEDQASLGRVRVKYPGLDDSVEGWWARIASPGAGQDRGLLMTPKVGDEVLVGFEGGDPHKPYVLGALWNGTATPGELVDPESSFNLKSDKFTNVTSLDAITIKTEKGLTIEVSEGVSESAGKGRSVTVSDNDDLSVGKKYTLSAGDELALKCGAASIVLKKDGTIEIKGVQVTIQGQGKVAVSSSAMVQVQGAQVMIG